jgi:DNA-binding response OmpR family regulator
VSKKVLIIDNDRDVLEIMQEALDYEGFDSVTAVDGEEYEQLIAVNDIDIVIIDYLLNGINGGEICHQIKCCPAFKHLPVIIMSAYPKVLQSLGNYGCDTFLPKPFDLCDLVTQINQLLHSQSNNYFKPINAREHRN